MENATKALIIAGAVLITILLITVGIIVFNAANDPINQAQNSSAQQAVQMFNEPFMANLGDEITAQQAKGLISSVIASNGKDENHKIKLTIDGKEETSVSSISSRYKYSAKEQYATDGYINAIEITKKGQASNSTQPQ